MRPITTREWVGREHNISISLARPLPYWPLIGCYRLNVSHGQEYPEQSIASYPVSTHSLGCIHGNDEDALSRPTQIYYSHRTLHVCPMSAVCASSQVKLSVCCILCRVGAGHDSLSYNTSPLIILMIHITPGHETITLPTLCSFYPQRYSHGHCSDIDNPIWLSIVQLRRWVLCFNEVNEHILVLGGFNQVNEHILVFRRSLYCLF